MNTSLVRITMGCALCGGVILESHAPAAGQQTPPVQQPSLWQEPIAAELSPAATRPSFRAPGDLAAMSAPQLLSVYQQALSNGRPADVVAVRAQLQRTCLERGAWLTSTGADQVLSVVRAAGPWLDATMARELSQELEARLADAMRQQSAGDVARLGLAAVIVDGRWGAASRHLADWIRTSSTWRQADAMSMAFLLEATAPPYGIDTVTSSDPGAVHDAAGVVIVHQADVEQAADAVARLASIQYLGRADYVGSADLDEVADLAFYASPSLSAARRRPVSQRLMGRADLGRQKLAAIAPPTFARLCRALGALGADAAARTRLTTSWMAASSQWLSSDPASLSWIHNSLLDDDDPLKGPLGRQLAQVILGRWLGQDGFVASTDRSTLARTLHNIKPFVDAATLRAWLVGHWDACCKLGGGQGPNGVYNFDQLDEMTWVWGESGGDKGPPALSDCVSYARALSDTMQVYHLDNFDFSRQLAGPIGSDGRAELQRLVFDDRGALRLDVGRVLCWSYIGHQQTQQWKQDLEHRGQSDPSGDRRSGFLLLRAFMAEASEVGLHDMPAAAQVTLPWSGKAVAAADGDAARLAAVRYLVSMHEALKELDEAAQVIDQAAARTKAPDVLASLRALRADVDAKASAADQSRQKDLGIFARQLRTGANEQLEAQHKFWEDRLAEARARHRPRAETAIIDEMLKLSEQDLAAAQTR